MLISSFEEEAEVKRLEEGHHVLRNNGRVFFLVAACFHCYRGAPYGVFTRAVSPAGKEGLVMVIFPLLGMGSAEAHSYTIVRARKHKVAQSALFFWG